MTRRVVHLPVIDHPADGNGAGDDSRFRRPRKLADCIGGVRPCPWVSCKFNLLIDVVNDGGIVLNAGHRRAEGGGRVIPPNASADERFRDELEDAVDLWFDEITDPPIPSCAIDEAVRRQPDDNSVTLLDEIAEMMFITRERVRQIEAGALRKLREDGVDLVAEFREILEDLRAQQDEREARHVGED